MAEQNLALGRDVVVDAVNDSVPAGETWVRAARASGARLVIGVLALADAVLRRSRLEGRTRPFVRVVEPTWARVEALTAGTAPWTDDVVRLDAARPPEELARAVLAAAASSSHQGPSA